MKIEELRDEQALTAAGRLLLPLEEILADEALRELVRGGTSRLRCAAEVLRRHPGAVMRVLAAAEDVPDGAYHCTAVSALHTLAELLRDRTITDFFTAAPQTPNSCGCACGKECTGHCGS